MLANMSKLVKFSSLSNLLKLCSNHILTWLCWPRGINKNPTVWLYGARQPPENIFKNNTSLKNSKIQPTQTIRTCFSRCSLNLDKDRNICFWLFKNSKFEAILFLLVPVAEAGLKPLTLG